MRILKQIKPIRRRLKMSYKPNDDKPSRVNPFATYGTTWNKMRLRYLAENPLCVFCKANGRLTPANVIDHIEPHRGDEKLFWDTANWQPLCKHCHDKVKSIIERNPKTKHDVRKYNSMILDGILKIE